MKFSVTENIELLSLEEGADLVDSIPNYMNIDNENQVLHIYQLQL